MLQKIIHQLNEEDYFRFHSEMEKAKANKIILLLQNYRHSKEEEENTELLSLLNVSKNTFYNLKSRLWDNLELFLIRTNCEPNCNIAKNEKRINNLIYNTPREIGILILNHLEKEFIKHDMTNELIMVYRAFKKIYLYTPDYTHYSQLYNKQISYLLAQEKAEDTLGAFSISLGNYYLSRDDSEFIRLNLLKKEMTNLSSLNNFPKIKIYNNILLIQYALFLSDIEDNYDNVFIGNLFKECDEIIQNHYHEKNYEYLCLVMNYLYFEYFKQLKLQNKATEYFNRIKDKQETISLYRHICFTSLFFLSANEYSSDQFKKDSKNVVEGGLKDIPKKENTLCYVFYHYNIAVSLFYKNRTAESIQIINKLFLEINFKNRLFMEIELRLLLSFFYVVIKENEHSKMIITSILRNIKPELNSPKYNNVALFSEIIKIANKKENKNKEEKIDAFYQRFKMNNRGKFKILEFLTVKDELLNKLKTI
jgi:hypothetical protein